MTPAPTGKQIFVRVDSSTLIGSGHLRRCLTLAQELRNANAHLTFICRQQVGSFHSEVNEAGFGLILLAEPMRSDGTGYAGWLGVDEPEDAHETVTAIGDSRCDIIIVDHYAIGKDWHDIVRKVAHEIVVIDDLANRTLGCDVIIDVAPADAARYDALIQKGARKLLGPDHALIAKPFFQQSRKLHAKRGPVSNVLIAYGASDNNNDTLGAIDGVRAALGSSATIHVVLGGHAPHLEIIRKRVASDPRLFLHIDTDKMAELMANADLAIGAGGTMSWERAYLGIPSMVSITAENQRITAEALAEAGCAILLPAGHILRNSIEHVTAALSCNPGILQMMATAAMNMVDGKGVKRISAMLLAPGLKVRHATASDSHKLWRWRNASNVRAMSISSDPISLDSHESWFAKQLSDPNCVMLIGYQGEVEIGVVRFDINGPIARISIQLADNVSSGLGIGSQLLKAADCWLDENRPDVEAVHAEVLEENSASLALFSSASYDLYQHQFRRKIFR